LLFRFSSSLFGLPLLFLFRLGLFLFSLSHLLFSLSLFLFSLSLYPLGF